LINKPDQIRHRDEERMQNLQGVIGTSVQGVTEVMRTISLTINMKERVTKVISDIQNPELLGYKYESHNTILQKQLNTMKTLLNTLGVASRAFSETGSFMSSPAKP
jgi:hypothetical protein